MENSDTLSKPAGHALDSTHVCSECGATLVGHYCHECGMPAKRQRLTRTSVVSGLLDIWGFGSRSIFRTLGHLFWRPGYTIADYLNGHQHRWFPPFQLLVTTTLVSVVVLHAAGIAPSVTSVGAQLPAGEDGEVPPFAYRIAQYFDAAIAWMNDNPAYSILLQSLFVVLATWMVFSLPLKTGRESAAAVATSGTSPATEPRLQPIVGGRPRYNMVETFVAVVYVSSPMQLLSVVLALLTGEMQESTFYPWYLPDILTWALLTVVHAQLYAIKWCQALWRTIVSSLLTMLLFLLAIMLTIFAVGFAVGAIYGPDALDAVAPQ